MVKDIRKDAIEDTYRDFEKMLFKLCWKAVKIYGGDFEGYLSTANLAFMKAYYNYDPEKGQKFSTFLYWYVRGMIMSGAEPYAMDQNTINTGGDLDMTVHAQKESFNIEEFFDDLSDDAKTVVGIITLYPDNLDDLLELTDIGECVRSGLIKKLRKLNWSIARVNESFCEIREAIK